MKKTILSIIPLLLAVACVRETEVVLPEQQAHEMVFHARMEQPDTRTVRMENGDIYWSPGDVIRIFHGKKSALFTAQNTEPSGQVDFAGTLPADYQDDGPFYALFASNVQDAELTIVNVSHAGTPGTKEYVPVEVPFKQAVPANTFAPGAFPSVAVAQGNDLYFQNICGGTVITVQRSDIRAIRIHGNRNEKICGTATHYYRNDPSDFPDVGYIGTEPNYTVSVTPAEGLFFQPGVKDYVSLLPTTLEAGMTVTYLCDNRTGVFSTDKEITIQRSHFGRLLNLDERATWTEEMANCYVVKPRSTVHFPTRNLPAEFQSNVSMAPQAAPTRASSYVYIVSYAVLWESYGTSTTPTQGSVVASVAADNNGGIVVTAGSREGNAVVAMKVNDDIVWSWHIWVTNADLEALAQTYRNFDGKVMDRNLGALSSKSGEVGSLGLLYQWGRKDPFPGASAIDANTMAATTATWPATQSSNAETGTFDYVVAHPMVYISSNSKNYDWYYTGDRYTDANRWHEGKGFFDPCPPGWHVPDYDLWENAIPYDGKRFTASTTPSWTSFSTVAKAAHLTTWFGASSPCWYPASGYLSTSGTTLRLSQVGAYGRYWSCDPSTTYYANSLYFSKDELMLSSSQRAGGYSVRCVKSNP